MRISQYGVVLRGLSGALLVTLLAACGGGGYAEVGIAGGGQPQIAGLELQLQQVGPEAVRVDWSFDPYASFYDVARDGYLLARVSSTNTLVDGTVQAGYRFCYQVAGYDAGGNLVSTTTNGCIVVQ